MERELIYLLADLCSFWGLCIAPEDLVRISKRNRWTAVAFAEEVAKCDGLEGQRSWVNRITQRFRERFGVNEIQVNTFVDRVREGREDWS